MLSAWSPLGVTERRTLINKKFEITDIAHETYPFLHRIRALQDIGNQVRTGDLGGFVEHEGNLSRDVADTAWIFDDAIVAGNARVDSGAQLRDYALACDNAHVSNGAVMSGNSRAEDNAYLRGAVLKDSARASGDVVRQIKRDNEKQIICSKNQLPNRGRQIKRDSSVTL